MSAFFVPTKFVWRFGGQQVHLCGSFTRWVETVPMAQEPSQPGIYSVIVHLPPGYHQYKFIVDGTWRHDETQPYMPDPLGNVNNWLFVRRPETAHQAGPGTAGQQHSPHQMHLPGHALQQQQQQQQAQAQAQTHQAPHPQQQQQPQPHMTQTQPQPATLIGVDVDMATAESSDGSGGGGNPSAHGAPLGSGGGSGGVAATMVNEPEYTRKKVREFAHSHTAYELIPESGKVVLLDTQLPVRQAFHALHDQGVASAPLWDAQEATVCGMISASDFIQILRRLRHSISTGGNAMSEAEMDQHTIRGLREDMAAEGRAPKALVWIRPSEHLGAVVHKLFHNRCSMAPVLASDNQGGDVAALLHIATMSGVLACLMRHFRASLASLPLLAQPISALPIGTWAPDSALVRKEAAAPPTQAGEERRERRRVRDLHTVTPNTLLTQALQMLLDAGVSAVPVVDESGALVNMYARSDITQLAKGNSYNRLQWEDVTVGQALALAQMSPQGGGAGDGMASKQQRVFACTVADPLRSVVERLSVPGVRRLFVVDGESRRVEAIISLSDVAAFLFL